MHGIRSTVCAAALCLMAISPASALTIDLGIIKIDLGGGGYGGGGGGGGGTSYGVPGPLAGVGLPVLAVFGGYVWLKKRNRRGKEGKSQE